MKKTIFTILILLSSTFSYVYSSTKDSLDNHKLIKTDNIQLEEKENDYPIFRLK